MFGNWTDLERTFAVVDELRRRMQRTSDEGESSPVAYEGAWPRTSLFDTGKALVLSSDIPGMNQGDLRISLTLDVLTLSGERRVEVPVAHSVHRQERRPMSFARSFTLPCKVDADAIEASLKNGVLTVTMPKSPESQPRQITVKAG